MLAPLPSNAATATAERRQLTVMFCDLVDSTSLSTRLDPEDLRDVIGAYRHRVSDAAARYDGFIASFMGDGVLIYFGYPQSHEEDAERAVRAGLATVAAVGSLRTRAAIGLQARVGIATGLVVVGKQIGGGETQDVIDVTGETPNLAARLQAVAAPGEIVIATSTRRLVGKMFDCHALGAVELKGLPQPVEAWRVRGETAGVSRFEALHAGELSPLVGRREEIELLLRRWGRAQAGEGRVVLLSGEPGIGKSHIAESLLAQLGSERLVRLRYFCSPHHMHSALYPFIAQLERAASFEPGSSVGAKLDRLEALLTPAAKSVPQDLALIAELLAGLTDGRYPALEVSPQQKREMTLTALLDQLDGAAAQKPVLILFEDAHWIDPTSLDLLDRMVARVADLPVLLVITFRPDLQPTWVDQPHVTMLRLNRVDRRDGAGILAGITKGKPLPDAVVEQILARTDGVPLFIEEFTRTLLGSGLLRETPDRYVLDGPMPPLAIPMTLQASLVSRLDRLTSAKNVAQIGSAIGREFSHELVAAVAALVPMELNTALERLTDSGLITRRGKPPDATYTFKHSLVQDAAYATLLKTRRQKLHENIANLLVERFLTTATGLPEVVAHHFTEAGLPSEAVGYWIKAGQLASARSANREAVRSFEHALSLLQALPESRSVQEQAFEICLMLRPVLMQLGEIRQSLERLRDAETLADQLDDDHRRGRVCVFVSNVHSILGALDEGLATGNRALEIARRLGDLRLSILCSSSLEYTHYFQGNYGRVVELATDNLASLPSDWVNRNHESSAPAPIYDRCWLVMSLAHLGKFAAAAEHETEALRLAEATHHAYTIGLAHWAAGTLHLIEGDWIKARSQIDRWIMVLRAGNVVHLLPTAVASSAWILAQVGESDEAVNRLLEGEHLLKNQAATGVVGNRGWAIYALGRACLALGRFDDARRLGNCVVESLPGQFGAVAQVLHLLGDVEAHSGKLNAGRGESCYRKALVLAEPRGMRPLVAHCHLGLGKLYRQTGKHEQAREHLTTATSMYGEMGMSLWLEKMETEMR